MSECEDGVVRVVGSSEESSGGEGVYVDGRGERSVEEERDVLELDIVVVEEGREKGEGVRSSRLEWWFCRFDVVVVEDEDEGWRLTSRRESLGREWIVIVQSILVDDDRCCQWEVSFSTKCLQRGRGRNSSSYHHSNVGG